MLSRGFKIATALAFAVVSAALIAGCGADSRTATEGQVDHAVGALFAGIPQQGAILGEPWAPVTMEVFIDLEDPTCRWWFREDLPAIVNAYVRTGALKLRYHAFKRNTFGPETFVKQQTAALAAGVQNKLWNYIDTFLYEQGEEFTPYVTESYLQSIASQTPGLNLARWHADRHTDRREEQTTSEDQGARTIGLHVTPAFRIGKTSRHMSNLTGRTMIQYSEQKHPIALINARDVANAIKLLDHGKQIPRNHTPPKIVVERLE